MVLLSHRHVPSAGGGVSRKKEKGNNKKIYFEWIRPKPGSGGKSALYVDGKKVAEGRIPKAQPYAFSGDEGVDVGVDNETMVSNDYKPGENRFTGKITKVTIDTTPSNLSEADKKTVEAAEAVAESIED